MSMLPMLTHYALGVPGYLAFALVVVWLLPNFGDKVLAFLRNLRRYRAGK